MSWILSLNLNTYACVCMCLSELENHPVQNWHHKQKRPEFKQLHLNSFWKTNHCVMLMKRRIGDQIGPLSSVPNDWAGRRKSSRLLNLSVTSQIVGFRIQIQGGNNLNNSSLPKHLNIDLLDSQLIISPTPLARQRTVQVPLQAIISINIARSGWLLAF